MFSSELTPLSVMESDIARLTCNVSGKPKPTISWLKDERPLLFDQRMRVTYDGNVCTLTILGAEIEDEGSYTCIATNDGGPTSSTARLVINVMNTLPRWRRKLTDVQTVEGEQARFQALIKAHPLPRVEWYKGSVLITESPKYQIMSLDEEGRYCLIVNNVNFNDAVSYKCVAINEVGKSTSRAMLDVMKREFAPEFDEEESPKPVIVQEGDEAAMMVTVRGYPKPDITWYRGEKLMYDSKKMGIRSHGNSHSLVIYRVNARDAGDYKCEAHNSIGTSYRLFDLIVKGNALLQSASCKLLNLLALYFPILHFVRIF